MVAKISIRALTACALALLALSSVSAQDHRKSDARNTQKSQSGLLDFALAGINANDRNYGQCFDEARQLLIHETLERTYFWSNLCAITVAGFLFIVVVYQRRSQRRSEQVVSEVIAQYHNGLERAEVQIREATKRNRALVKVLSSPAASTVPDSTPWPDEPVPQRKNVGRPRREDPAAGPPPAAQAKGPEPSQSTPRSPATKVNTPAAAVNAVQEGQSRHAEHTNMNMPPATAKAVNQEKSNSAGQMGLFGSEVDLIGKINVLQQQLSSSQEREKHLRRQLNDSELRFQKEQQKARTLQS